MLEDKTPILTELGKLGRLELIKYLEKGFPVHHEGTIKTIGDDACVLNLTKEESLLSNSLFLEGVHFNLTYFPLKHLGYKILVNGLNDIYAMNARPTHAIVSIAVSNRFSLEATQEVYQGMRHGAKEYKIDLITRDITSSTSGLVVSMSVIGGSTKEKIVYRNGANANDLLVASGDFGAAYMGLKILEREHRVFKLTPGLQPDLSEYHYILERQLRPRAKVNILKLFEKLDIKPTSMIHVSNSLAFEILELCNQSALGCRVFENKIPIDFKTALTSEEFNLNPSLAALNGGEDYELLCSLSLRDYEKIKAQASLKIIGHMTSKEEGTYLVENDSRLVPLIAQGYKPSNEE